MSAPLVLHATTVAFEGRAALILGPSGSGKSALALQLIAWGAALVADDRTELHLQGPDVIASCPPAIRGKIEARFMGLLSAAPADPTPLRLVVDLSKDETDRLPPARTYEILGQALPLVHKFGSSHFPAAVLQYLKHANDLRTEGDRGQNVTDVG